MQIEEIQIYGLRGIVAFEHRLYDEWLARIPRTLLVSGLNGSGKTTLLDAIAGLWSDLGSWLDGKKHARPPRDWLFADSRLAAVKFVGVLGGDRRPIWIFAARPNEFKDLTTKMEGCHYAGIVNYGRDGLIVEMDDPNFWKTFGALRNANVAEGRRDLPNVVYVGSDDRRMPRPTKRTKIMRDMPENNWLARYASDPPLAQVLYRMEAQFPKEFAEAMQDVNKFLEKKWIVGFDDAGTLRVQTEYGATHDVHALSTGERQAFLLIAFARRWLRPGGILLVDEPDLYMHPSWIEQIASVLSQIAESRDGQFLFTSHSPLLWENYSRPANRIQMGVKVLNLAGAAITTSGASGVMNVTKPRAPGRTAGHLGCSLWRRRQVISECCSSKGAVTRRR